MLKIYVKYLKIKLDSNKNLHFCNFDVSKNLFYFIKLLRYYYINIIFKRTNITEFEGLNVHKIPNRKRF